MEKHQFKPFDMVLVRNANHNHWRCAMFSHIQNDTFVTTGMTYHQCLPYNEETAHLLGTTKPYELPQPKEYHVWTSGSFDEWMTEDEFQNFIKTAVINNKDITDFHVLRIK